MKRKDK